MSNASQSVPEPFRSTSSGHSGMMVARLPGVGGGCLWRGVVQGGGGLGQRGARVVRAAALCSLGRPRGVVGEHATQLRGVIPRTRASLQKGNPKTPAQRAHANTQPLLCMPEDEGVHVGHVQVIGGHRIRHAVACHGLGLLRCKPDLERAARWGKECGPE